MRLKVIVLTVLYLCYRIKCDNFDSTLAHVKPSARNTEQEDAVNDLIKRILPGRHDDFVVNVKDIRISGKDTFTVEKTGDKIKITGNSGVSVANGFHYYLKYFCHCHISWEASQLNLPNELPFVNVTISLNDRFRYYQNVCTPSYSFVWWNWEQWEKHIDWMALYSFNFVLTFQGQEAIWKRVYKNLGLTEEDINEHFTGPAFLSWLRMGNLRGWAGPLSDSWHARTLFLQKKIIERMRSLGIITILPAFAGHLPRAFRRIYPHVNMTKMMVWNSFNDTYCCPYFLDPMEDLFKTIGKMFIEEQLKEYGTDHVYNCDSFNEVDPVSSELNYLSNVGKSIYSAMTIADSKAIWLMQGWLFVHSFFFWTKPRAKALLTSVPTGKMIVLDLQSEQFPQYNRLNQYFGQPYIWCMLHNFGGTLGMHGSAEIINEEVLIARNQANSTMIGVGLTMEGINQNYVIYDLMSESSWRTNPSNLTNWFQSYSRRRYGMQNVDVETAWQILKESVYNFHGLQRIRGQYAITKTPSLNIFTWSWYDYSQLYKAWDYFIKASDNLKQSPAFLHDLVDVTRQVLQVNGDIYYNELIKAFRRRDKQQFQYTATTFKQIFIDLDEILSTNEAFLLGRWLEDAKNCANNTQDKALFEYNARNQITLWGPKGEIMNYANKQWAGVVSHFFYPRWSLFIDEMNRTMIENVKFNQSAATEKMFRDVEQPFTFDKNVFPTKPTGDSIEIAKKIHKKYRNVHLQHHRVVRSSKETEGTDFEKDTINPTVVVVDL